MNDQFECFSCGNDTFKIGKRTMFGSEEPYIDGIECDNCGEEYQEAPRPSKIRPR